MDSKLSTLVSAEKGEDFDLDECRKLLQRILDSPEIKRAPRLGEFLSFVTMRVLDGDCSGIHEQEIGSRLFGRPANYDTSQDNIVRATASELRKRVESYFDQNGASEPLLLEIPRGSYLPIFRRRTPAELPARSPTPVAPPPEEVSPAAPLFVASGAVTPVPARPSRISVVALSTTAFALAVACGVLLHQNGVLRSSSQRWAGKPTLNAFWSGFLNSAPQTDVVLGDSTLVLMEEIFKKPIPLSDYLNHDYERMIQHPEISADRQTDLEIILPHSSGNFGDFRASRHILDLDPTYGKFRLNLAREYNPAGLKQDNVILIGSSKSNPWVDLFADRFNFIIEYDPNLQPISVRNRAPRSGEQPDYVIPVGSYASIGYSVVAYLPTPSHAANALILAGTNSEATDAASEFITSEEPLARFKNMLHVNALPYFEVLLRTTQLKDTPLNAEIVAYRTYPEIH